MILQFRQVPIDPDEAALWWSSRRQLRMLSAREESAFQRWLQEPYNAEAWDSLNRPLEAFDEFGAMPEIKAMRARALSPSRPRSLYGIRRWAGGAIAASLAALLFLAMTNPSGLTFGKSTPAHIARYASALGERRDVRLTDGSVVTLDTASTIEAAYSDRVREIHLIDGQARFDVAPNKHRPFIVIAGDRRITAVGTKFDVEVGRDGFVKVLLLKGRVKVEPVRLTGISRLLPIISANELTPGEQLISKSSGEVSIGAPDITKETSWQNGQLVFRDDRLADAVAEMNRYSEAKIVLVDEAIEDLRISGVFRTDRPENFLAAVTAFYPVVADRQTAGVITVEWRDGQPRTADAKRI
jgi:transmembrane sensor